MLWNFINFCTVLYWQFNDSLNNWCFNENIRFALFYKEQYSVNGACYRLQLICLSWVWEKSGHHTSREILLHDNARPHVAKSVKSYPEMFQWEVLSHPLYSTDITDYHLLRSMADGFREQRFFSFEEFETWIDSLAKDDSITSRKMGGTGL